MSHGYTGHRIGRTSLQAAPISRPDNGNRRPSPLKPQHMKKTSSTAPPPPNNVRTSSAQRTVPNVQPDFDDDDDEKEEEKKVIDDKTDGKSPVSQVGHATEHSNEDELAKQTQAIIAKITLTARKVLKFVRLSRLTPISLRIRHMPEEMSRDFQALISKLKEKKIPIRQINAACELLFEKMWNAARREHNYANVGLKDAVARAEVRDALPPKTKPTKPRRTTNPQRTSKKNDHPPSKSQNEPSLASAEDDLPGSNVDNSHYRDAMDEQEALRSAIGEMSKRDRENAWKQLKRVQALGSMVDAGIEWDAHRRKQGETILAGWGRQRRSGTQKGRRKTHSRQSSRSNPR